MTTPEALFEVARRLNQNPEVDLIYCDEDKLDAAGRHVTYFKPDWSPDLLLSTNYITHFVVMRRERLAEVGGFRPGFEGSQDYDLLLRVTEGTSRIAHIAKILYHWRMTPSSASQSANAKPWDWKAGERAL